MSDIFITIDPTVPAHKGGFAKMFYEYITENKIPYEISNRATIICDNDNIGLYHINSWGGVSRVTKVFGSKYNPSTNSVSIDPAKFWSVINKQNTLYTTEEWVNIICAANSADLESRQLSLSLVKNADCAAAMLTKLVLTLVLRHKKDPEIESYSYRFLISLYSKNNLNKEIDIEYYTTLLSYEEFRPVLSDPKILNIFMNKYRHWIDFTGVKIKNG